MIASTRRLSAVRIIFSVWAGSTPVRPSITLVSPADNSSTIASIVASKIELEMYGMNTATSLLFADASPPAIRFGI